MRIAIDATSVPPKPAGAGVYAIELVRALAHASRADGYALFTQGTAFDGITDGLANWRLERVDASSRGGRIVWEQARLPGRLAALGIDVLHSTHHTLPVLGVQAKRVVTIHDVTFFRIPKRYPLVRRLYMRTSTRLSARVADAIIVPSNAIRSDTARVLGVPTSRLATVYEAAGPQFVELPNEQALATVRGLGIEPPYLLSVGSLEPGKNRGRLLQALRTLRDRGIERRLVIVGQPAWDYVGDEALVRDLGLADIVHRLGYVDGSHLPALYCAAEAFIFPSLYEGFGLPVLEAMACGTPVLTSNVSATAEVSGDAALLVDPYDVDAIALGLRRLIQDSSLSKELRRRGKERAASFSWTRAAAETHTVYERVARGEAPE